MDRKKLAIMLLFVLAMILPMVAFDFLLGHFFGKEATPFTMGGNLAYAFLVLKPLSMKFAMWLKDRP